MQHLPSTKILAVLIICLGVVGSVWLYQNGKGTESATVSTYSTSTVIDTAHYPSNWVTPDNIPLASTTIATTYSGEGTITDQISKDFFSQYLSLLKQGNGEISATEANQIAQSIMSNPEYLKSTGVVYTTKNLTIKATTSAEITRVYGAAMTNIINKYAPQDRIDPVAITKKAYEDNKESELSKLDPAIAAEKTMIKDLLALSVPSDAVSIHLEFINAASNILANTEAFRNSFVDPVRGFVALSQFPQHQIDMINAFKKVSVYIKSK